MELKEKLRILESFDGGVKYFVGDFEKLLEETVKAKAYLGKIAFITLKDTHSRYIKKILPAVSAAGAKIISMVMPPVKDYTVEYFSPLFNLPDDVRLVFVMDRELFRAGSYYARIKGLPLAFAPLSACAAGIIEKTFYLKNGDRADEVLGAEETLVLIDEKLIDNGAAESYAFNMARTLSMIDMLICAEAFKDPVDADSYLLIKDAVLNSHQIYSAPVEKRAVNLFLNGLKIQTAERILGFLERSSERSAVRLYARSFKTESGAELFYALKLMEIFSIAFSVKGETERTPVYRMRAEKVAAMLSLGEKETGLKLLEQTQKIRPVLKEAVKVMNRLKPQAEDILYGAETVKSTYLSLGGQESFGVKGGKEALKYCGDCVFGINAMSFIRELGLTD